MTSDNCVEWEPKVSSKCFIYSSASHKLSPTLPWYKKKKWYLCSWKFYFPIRLSLSIVSSAEEPFAFILQWTLCSLISPFFYGVVGIFSIYLYKFLMFQRSMYFKYFSMLVILFFWLCLWKFLAYTHTYTHVSEWITACFMSLSVYLVGGC